MTSWIDIEHRDIEAAKTFYGGLFGWTFTDVAPPVLVGPADAGEWGRSAVRLARSAAEHRALEATADPERLHVEPVHPARHLSRRCLAAPVETEAPKQPAYVLIGGAHAGRVMRQNG